MASPTDPNRNNTLTVPIAGMATDTDAAKLNAIKETIRLVIQDRLSILRDEAETISNDMEALTLRLAMQGHEAEMTDIRTNRWYRTTAQLSCLRKLYQAVCDICGEEPDVVFAVSGSDTELQRITGTLDAITDE